MVSFAGFRIKLTTERPDKLLAFPFLKHNINTQLNLLAFSLSRQHKRPKFTLRGWNVIQFLWRVDIALQATFLRWVDNALQAFQPLRWNLLGYDDFEGGHSFFLLWFRGGCGKFPAKITSNIRGGGGNHFLDLLVSKYKKTQGSLMLSKSWKMTC